MERLILDPGPSREGQLLTRRRIRLLCWLICLLAAVLASRMFVLQILDHEHFSTLARGNYLKIVPIPPVRGRIYSSDGVLLAGNVPAYDLVLRTEYLDSLERALPRLQGIVELEDAGPAAVRGQRKSKFRRHFAIKRGLSEQEVARFWVNNHFFPGFEIVVRFRRHYPLADIAMPVIGYVSGIDDAELERVEDRAQYLVLGQIGKAGIEKRYEHLLKGKPGYQRVEVNAEGSIVRVLEVVPPRRGQTLRLHLDAALQVEAYYALEGKKGSVVAVEPGSGRIKALVSYPAYDPNLFVAGISGDMFARLRSSGKASLFNRAIAGQYPPGSTIKPFLALAGMHYEAAPETGLWCPGWFSLPGRPPRVFRDWRKSGHGRMDILAAVEESCDVFFYRLALELGIERMGEFLGHFGFGRRTGIGLEGEKAGLVPSREWKRERRGERWYPGDTVVAGIGQGYMLATPLQLAMATAALAIHGERRRPSLLGGGAAEGAAGSRPVPVPVRDAGLWESIEEAMIRVVHGGRGTGRAISRGLGFTVAGKTGTAQVVALEHTDADKALPEEHRDHSLFIAYAPVPAPLLAVAVIVEHGGSGSATAAPLAKRLLVQYLEGRLERQVAGSGPSG